MKEVARCLVGSAAVDTEGAPSPARETSASELRARSHCRERRRAQASRPAEEVPSAGAPRPQAAQPQALSRVAGRCWWLGQVQGPRPPAREASTAAHGPALASLRADPRAAGRQLGTGVRSLLRLQTHERVRALGSRLL